MSCQMPSATGADANREVQLAFVTRTDANRDVQLAFVTDEDAISNVLNPSPPVVKPS